MKHARFILLAIAAFAIAACQEPNAPTPGGTGGGGSQVEKIADFTYDVSGLDVYFKNTSSGDLSVYSWNFGDGKTDLAHNDVMHIYEKEGEYDVRLVCKDKNGIYYNKTKTIIIDGSHSGYKNVYIKGITMYEIPYDNKYYQVKITSHSLMGKEEDLVSVVKQVSYSQLPYSGNINPPYMVCSLFDIDYIDHFTATVYYANSSSSVGTQCLKQTFSITQDSHKEEYVLTSSNTKIGVVMEYK